MTEGVGGRFRDGVRVAGWWVMCHVYDFHPGSCVCSGASIHKAWTEGGKQTHTHTHTNRSTGRHTNNNKQYLTSFGGGKLGLVLTSGCADNNPLLSRLTIPQRAADLNPHFSPPPPPITLAWWRRRAEWCVTPGPTPHRSCQSSLLQSTGGS